ncbi:hypothetical protein ACWCOZ_20650 [Streptomyces sp. NPDC001840]
MDPPFTGAAHRFGAAALGFAAFGGLFRTGYRQPRTPVVGDTQRAAQCGREGRGQLDEFLRIRGRSGEQRLGLVQQPVAAEMSSSSSASSAIRDIRLPGPAALR